MRRSNGDQPLAQPGLEFRAEVNTVLGAELHQEFAAIGVYELDVHGAGAGVMDQGFL